MSKKILYIIVLAFLIRVTFLMCYPDIYSNTGRMMTQYNIAENIAEGNGFRVNIEYISKATDYNNNEFKNIDYYILKDKIKVDNQMLESPKVGDTWGYATLLGILWSVSPLKTYRIIQILQIIIDSLMCYFVFHISFIIFKSERISLLSSVLYAIYLPFIFFSILVLRDVFASWGIILGTFFFLKSIESYTGLIKNRLLYLLISGIVISVLCWFRPTIIFLPGVYLIYLLILNYKKLIKNFIYISIIGMIILFFFALPFGRIYYNSYGTYNFLSKGAGLWEGLGEIENPYGFKCDDNAAFERAAELGYVGEPWSPEFHRILKDDAMQTIKKHPEFYAKALLNRLKRSLTASIPEMIIGKNGEDTNYKAFQKKYGGGYLEYFNNYPFIFLFKLIQRVLGVVLPILAFLCLIFYRDKLKVISILPLIYLYRISANLPTHIEERYVLEGYAPILILVAASLDFLLSSEKKKYLRISKSNMDNAN